jgi:dTDP-glucose pyrophosphorylase
MKQYIQHIIPATYTIRDALATINTLEDGAELTLFVVNADNVVVGSITDGDIRRGLLQGHTLDATVSNIMYRHFRYIHQSQADAYEQITYYKKIGIKLTPILNDQKQLIKLVNLFQKKSILPIDAVLMAGGRGERLRPLTDNLPKPLLKVGEKPIIEYNVDRLIEYGVDNFYLSVKYLAHLLEDYFGNGAAKDVAIQYIHEDNPLGTIGAVSLIKNFQHTTVLVMNSDLLTNIDFEDFYRNFLQEDAAMAVATIPYQVNIPYGILETEQSRVTALKEKPTYTYYANAGIYLLRRDIVELIPHNQFFNATDLIELLIQQGYKVAHYPILGYWLDIGKPDDFRKAQEDIKHIKL